MNWKSIFVLLTVFGMPSVGLGQNSQEHPRVQVSEENSDPIAQYREAATKKWEDAILKLEERDRREQDPEHAILFVGSSSIRRWDTIAEDMKPWTTIQRGYGGAKFSDVAVYADRLTKPHQFDALVIFVANDIAGKETDKTPEEVLRLVQYVVQRVRDHHPDPPIFFIAITPTSSRFDVWPKIRKVNQLVQEYCEANSGTHFIETASHYLNSAGSPRDELFVDDKLHLNPAGYKIWATLISTALAEVLGAPAE